MKEGGHTRQQQTNLHQPQGVCLFGMEVVNLQMSSQRVATSTVVEIQRVYVNLFLRKNFVTPISELGSVSFKRFDNTAILSYLSNETNPSFQTNVTASFSRKNIYGYYLDFTNVTSKMMSRLRMHDGSSCRVAKKVHSRANL